MKSESQRAYIIALITLRQCAQRPFVIVLVLLVIRQYDVLLVEQVIQYHPEGVRVLQTLYFTLTSTFL